MSSRAPGSRYQCHIKSFAQVESADSLNLASETPPVFHGPVFLAGRRDVPVGCALWLSTKRLLDVGMRGGNSDVLGSFLLGGP